MLTWDSQLQTSNAKTNMDLPDKHSNSRLDYDSEFQKLLQIIKSSLAESDQGIVMRCLKLN